MCLVAGLTKKGDRNVPRGLPKKRRPDRNGPGGTAVVASKKEGGLTVTVQCTAVRTQSNLVIGTSWCLVVLGGAWWNTWWHMVEYLVEYLVAHLVVLGGAWWHFVVLGGILGGTWWYLVE